ncbi:helix-turn-helix domain-containing protein [Propionicicella superfundia]|uniref:helix-turn-helix domain-containing protein n=1 Tax=Propionicicella superfundia TaxID=348582 RepID=UPI0004041035|nr:helix-turn-helix domain-containing protein [Propionicicella superfundia]
MSRLFTGASLAATDPARPIVRSRTNHSRLLRIARVSCTPMTLDYGPGTKTAFVALACAAGTLDLRQDPHGTMAVHPGALALVTTSRPLRIEARRGADLSVLIVPLDRIDTATSGALRTTIDPLGRSTPVERALHELVRAASMSGEPLRDLEERVALDLATGSVTARMTPAGPDPRPRDDDLGARIDRLIAAGHKDSGFGVTTIAQALNLSVRHLYRLLSQHGVDVATRIADHRVATAAALLEAEPGLPLVTVADLSGFTSTDLLRRHFLRVRGTTAADHRTRLRRTERPGPATRPSRPGG